MKWSILVLIVLGLLAALSAVLLVNALRTERRAQLSGKGEVEAVVATRELPAMSRVTSKDIKVKKVARQGLARDYFAEPVQVVGKVLCDTVVKDQPLTRSCLIAEGGGAQLAATLRDGMRAMSVPVPRHSVMGGLLYPGCFVDVIWTRKLRSRQTDKGEAFSTTLLPAVQVLAVEDESIISKPDPEEQKSPILGTGSRRELTVTLMVDTKQAQDLQLAMENGKITLSMRNPLDQRPIEGGPTVLSEGVLARLGQTMEPSVLATASDMTDLIDANSPLEQIVDSPGGPGVSRSGNEGLRGVFGGGFGSWGRLSQHWEITVIRGQKVKEEVVDVKEADVLTEHEDK